jgi:hypothetical protein
VRQTHRMHRVVEGVGPALNAQCVVVALERHASRMQGQSTAQRSWESIATRIMTAHRGRQRRRRRVEVVRPRWANAAALLNCTRRSLLCVGPGINTRAREEKRSRKGDEEAERRTPPRRRRRHTPSCASCACGGRPPRAAAPLAPATVLAPCAQRRWGADVAGPCPARTRRPNLQERYWSEWRMNKQGTGKNGSGHRKHTETRRSRGRA